MPAPADPSRARLRRAWVALFAVILAGCGDPKKPEAVWCETGTGPGEVVYPRPITYDANLDNFYVIDRVAHVQRLDREGKCLADWRMPEWQMGKPVGAKAGPDGNLWVPDTHYHRVVVYSPDGKLLTMFGTEGTGDGQFMLPTDVAFEGDKVFVSEFDGLTAGGASVRQIPPAGWRRTSPLAGAGTVSIHPALASAGPIFGDVQVSTVPMNFDYLLALAQHYNQPGTFATGDVTGDDTVNFNDLLVVAQNYGHPLAATASVAGSENASLLLKKRR